jgi:hypothetical protein
MAKEEDDLSPEERKRLRDELWEEGMNKKKDKDLNPKDLQERKRRRNGNG